jgi:hypothetical protein
VGWRNIIEKMHMTATLTKWYEEHGRHEIFAGGKKVGMSHVGHDLALNMAPSTPTPTIRSTISASPRMLAKKRFAPAP